MLHYVMPHSTWYATTQNIFHRNVKQMLKKKVKKNPNALNKPDAEKYGKN